MLKTCFIKLSNLVKFLLKLLSIYAIIVLIYLVMEILPIIISSKFNINIETCKNVIWGIAFIAIGIFSYNCFKPLIKALEPTNIELIITKIVLILGALSEILVGISLITSSLS